MFEAALGTALAVLLMLSYFNWKRVAGLGLVIDFLLTFGLAWLFAGTYAGVMTGIIAGLIISIVLKASRRVFGYERPVVRRRRGALLPCVIWIQVPGLKEEKK